MNDKFEEYLKKVEKGLYDIFPSEMLPQGEVIKAAEYSLSAGGKRIRPVLVLAFCEMCGGDPDNALDVAHALEYMHTYSLIHDDLPCMDNDDIRRGKPSCHKAFGEATALLAGDALAILPFEAIARSRTISAETAVKCIGRLARCCGTLGMIGGQQIDTCPENGRVPDGLITSVYRMKTSDLIEAACVCGVFCAESADETVFVQRAAEYAENLGLAFQIIDDILDVTSTDEVLGKPVGSDIEQHKNTYVSAYGLEAAEKAAADYTGKALAALGTFENNEFLTELTKSLLVRKK